MPGAPPLFSSLLVKNTHVFKHRPALFIGHGCGDPAELSAVFPRRTHPLEILLLFRLRQFPERPRCEKRGQILQLVRLRLRRRKEHKGNGCHSDDCQQNNRNSRKFQMIPGKIDHFFTILIEDPRHDRRRKDSLPPPAFPPFRDKDGNRASALRGSGRSPGA